MRFRGLSTAQRVVIVIGLGVSFYLTGNWLIEYIQFGSRVHYGWVAYAPLQNSVAQPRDMLYTWVVLVIWLLVTLLWTMCSLAILHRRAER